MKVSLRNGDISSIPKEEIEAYKDYVKNKYPNDIIDEIILEFEGEDVKIDIIDEIILEFEGEYVKIETHKHSIPFNRIRRITGYLVGTLERFNDGKRSEERDRVKHGVEES